MEFIKENIIVDQKTGCWNWNKSCNSAGYGHFTRNGKYWTTHKFAYTMVKGTIPEGNVVRHSCHNPRCCNPEHLSIGTNRDNYHDSIDAHRNGTDKRRMNWIIDGWIYDSIRDAVTFTGIPFSAIIKHSVNGVFNVESYRESCIKGHVKPKL